MGTTGDTESKTAPSAHKISHHYAFHLLVLKALTYLEGNILVHIYFVNMLVFIKMY